MLQGNKSTEEFRFELLIMGMVLVVAAVLYVVLPDDLRSLMLFLPGLILLGAAIYQDMQPDWRAGWLMYALAILMVATGLAGIVNMLLGNIVRLNWIVIAIFELGAILIAKALYDPSPRS
ncbi:MAG: hypothetical protein JXB07_03570 [Anaerolineae bacterium]|nr:hypothetical protein [Anaerolineae bacterium]